MASLITIKATVSGNLATNPAFQKWIMGRVDAMAEAGAQQVVKEHRIETQKWNRKPAFDIRQVLDVARLLAAREIRITGNRAQIWMDINYGGPPVVINLVGTGRIMRFQFKGRGVSYKAKSDGFGGQQVGPKFSTQQVGMGPGGPRQIRARNLIPKVKARQANVWAVMEKVIR